MKALVVGSGPVGCMAAIRFVECGWKVTLFDAGQDPRVYTRMGRRSINLTLCKRGLRTLPERIRDLVYERGVACVHRVVHQPNGELVSLPYGMNPDEHLLSISRERLNQLLLDEAERAGVELRFGHDCIRANPDQASATFLAHGSLVELNGDILLGCDGSNSMVRHEMSRRGARMSLHQEHIAHAYIELVVPATDSGEYAWPPVRGLVYPDRNELEHGLHVWPRGKSMIFAQPNTDKSYTLSLFVPRVSSEEAGQGFDSLTTPDAVRAFFQRNFANVIPHAPRLEEDFLSAVPAALRTMKCAPYHHGRAVLLGDAAHTMVPFFGQGVNSGFEDVYLFFRFLAERTPGINLEDHIRRAVANYANSRTASTHAITDLSLGNFHELVDHSGKRSFQLRHALERRLQQRSPDKFQPLLHMVSFSDLSYAEIVRVHDLQRAKLDRLCQMFDPEVQGERIIQAYIEDTSSPSRPNIDGPASLTN